MQIKDRLEEVLGDLKNTKGIEASAAASRDGLLICSTIPPKLHAETFAAMSATMFGAAEITARELGKGTLNRIIVESIQGKVIAAGVESAVLLIVMTRPDANLGLVLIEIERALDRIKQILGSMT